MKVDERLGSPFPTEGATGRPRSASFSLRRVSRLDVWGTAAFFTHTKGSDERAGTKYRRGRHDYVIEDAAYVLGVSVGLLLRGAR